MSGNVAFENKTDPTLGAVSLLSVSEGTLSFIDNGSNLEVDAVNGELAIINADADAGITGGVAGNLYFSIAAESGSTLAQGDYQVALNSSNQPVQIEAAVANLNIVAGPYFELSVFNLNLNFGALVVTGDFSVKTVNNGTEDLDLLLGNNVSVFVGSGEGDDRVGLLISDGQAVFYQEDGDEKAGFIEGRVQVLGIPDFTIEGVVSVEFNSFATEINQTFTLNGEDINLVFDATQVDGYAAISATDVNFSIADTLDLSGSFYAEYDSATGQILLGGTGINVSVNLVAALNCR